MDTDDLGACIVAIPDDASIPVDVEGGAHVTLTYLGDDLLSEEQVNEILDILIEVSNDYPVQGPAEVLEVDYFGDDQDAVQNLETTTLSNTLMCQPLLHIKLLVE